MRFSNAFLNNPKTVGKILIAQLGEDTFAKAMSQGYQAGIAWINVHPEITPEEIIKFFNGKIKSGFFYNLMVENVLSLDKLAKLIPYTEMSDTDLLHFLGFSFFNNVNIVDIVMKYHSKSFTDYVQTSFLQNAIYKSNISFVVYCLEKFNPVICGEVLNNAPNFISAYANQLVKKLPENVIAKLAEYVPYFKLLYIQQTTDIKNLSWKELLFGETGYAGLKKISTSYGEFRNILENLFAKYSSLFPHNFELLQACMENLLDEGDKREAIDIIYYKFNDIPNDDWNAFFEKYPLILIRYYSIENITKRAFSFTAWKNAVDTIYNYSSFTFSAKIESFSSLVGRVLLPLPEVLYKIKAVIKQLLFSDENLSDKVAPNLLIDLYEYNSLLGREAIMYIFNNLFEKNDPEMNAKLIRNNFSYDWDKLTDVIPREAFTSDFKLKFFKCAMDAYDENRIDVSVEDLYEISSDPELIRPAIELIGKLSKERTRKIFFTRKDYDPEECKELFVSDWKQSSRIPGANAVQLVMTEMDKFKGERVSNIYFNDRTPQHFNSDVLNECIPPEARKNMQQFLSSVYSRTQASLMTDIKQDPDIEYDEQKNLLHLYRGVSEIYNISAPLESWTSKHSIADGFDGADILEVWVPMEAVYVSWVSPDWKTAKDRDSAGLKESEYILITSKVSNVKRENNIDFKEALKNSENKIGNWLTHWISFYIPLIGDVGYFITEASLPKLYEAIGKELVPLVIKNFPSIFDITEEDKELAYETYRPIISHVLFGTLNFDKITPQIRGAYSMTIDRITKELILRLFGETVKEE